MLRMNDNESYALDVSRVIAAYKVQRPIWGPSPWRWWHFLCLCSVREKTGRHTFSIEVQFDVGAKCVHILNYGEREEMRNHDFERVANWKALNA